MDTLLSSKVSVADYKAMEEARDLVRIAELVKQRFEERYLVPVEIDHKKKHGFTIMAVSCLMI